MYRPNNHCYIQRADNIDTFCQFVQEWVEYDLLKINFTPTIDNTPSEDIYHTYATKLVKHIPNQTEMCHFTSAGYEDLVHENEQYDSNAVQKFNA
jgi:DNA polymerase sigma